MRPLRGAESLFSFWQEQDEYADDGQARGTTEGDAGSTSAVGSTRLVAVVSDVHVPDHDVRAWEAFLAWVSDWQPDEIVIAGDYLELESCSQHGGVAQPKRFVEEIAAGRRELERLRECAPNAAMVYLEGNHETRLSRSVVAKLPTIDGALDIPTQLDLASLGIEWKKEGVIHDVGKLSVVHGWYCPKYHAAKHVDTMGCSVMYGHTHRPQFYTTGIAGGAVRGGFGLPCMRTLDAPWLNGKPSGWLNGFGVVHVFEDGGFAPEIILMTQGRFAWGGRVYGT